MPLSNVNPFHHGCDLADLDYSQVADGLITCTVCPRQWHLVPLHDKGARWINSCEVRPIPGRVKVDWLADVVPYPKPTQEEIIANRQARLEMLDQKAREAALRYQDNEYFFNWLQKERGHDGKVDHEWYAEMLAKEQTGKRLVVQVRLRLRFSSVNAALSFLRTMSR